jgi:hypothetical protein
VRPVRIGVQLQESAVYMGPIFGILGRLFSGTCIAPWPAMSTSDHDSERRRTPRVSILPRFHGQIVKINDPFVLLEIGAGGFSVMSPVPFVAGETHMFQLLVDGHATALPAVAVHCLRVNRDHVWPDFVCGFATGLDLSAAVDLLQSMLPAPMNGQLAEVTTTTGA